MIHESVKPFHFKAIQKYCRLASHSTPSPARVSAADRQTATNLECPTRVMWDP